MIEHDNALVSTHSESHATRKQLRKRFVVQQQAINVKCVDKEPNTLVVSFLEMSSMRNVTAVADKKAIRISLCTRNRDCMSYNVVHAKMFAFSASL